MKKRTAAALKKEIAQQIKAGGIARLDLYAEEYAAIKDAPQLRGYACQVTACPARLAKGDSNVGDAEIARCCWVRLPYTPPEPDLIEWHNTEAEANARAAELQAESPAAVVKAEHAWRIKKPHRIFGEYIPRHPEGRHAWAVHRWNAGAYMQRHFISYHPAEVMAVMQSLARFAYGFAFARPRATAGSKAKGERNRARVRAAFEELRKHHPGPGNKDYIQRRLAGEIKLPKTSPEPYKQGLRPRLSLRTIKTHTADME